MEYLWNNFGLISECSIKTSSNAHVDFTTPSNSHAFMVETFHLWFSQTDAYREKLPQIIDIFSRLLRISASSTMVKKSSLEKL